MAKPHTLNRSQNFARNLRAWMRDRKLSLRDAARLTGIDYRLLQRWASKGISRNGKSTREPFAKLVRAMGIKSGPASTSAYRDWFVRILFMNADLDVWRADYRTIGPLLKKAEAVLRFAGDED